MYDRTASSNAAMFLWQSSSVSPKRSEVTKADSFCIFESDSFISPDDVLPIRMPVDERANRWPIPIVASVTLVAQGHQYFELVEYQAVAVITRDDPFNVRPQRVVNPIAQPIFNTGVGDFG